MAADEEDMPRTLAALERNMLASQQMLREVVAHQRQAFDDDPSPHARRMCGTVMLWCTELLGAQDAGTACRACASHVRASVTHDEIVLLLLTHLSGDGLRLQPSNASGQIRRTRRWHTHKQY